MSRLHYAGRMHAFFMLSLTALGISLAGTASNAANLTWSGLGTDSFWATASNWVSGVAPAAGDALTFAGFQKLSPTNNYVAGTQFSGITFDASAASFALSGNTVNLAGNITDNSLNSQSSSLALVLQQSYTISVATINSALTLSGVISGAYGLTETGNGLLTLSSGGNTFSGPITIKGGELAVSSDLSLGPVPAAPTSGSIVIDGGAFRPGTTIKANRGITLGDAAPGTGGIFDVTVFATINGVIANASGGTNSFTKTGFGQLGLGGGTNGANTYTGNTIINQGVLGINFQSTFLGTTPVSSNIINSASALVMGGLPINLGGQNTSVTNNIGSATAALSVSPSNNGVETQSFNGLTLNQGYMTIGTGVLGSGKMLLSLGSITQNSGGIVNITTGGAFLAGSNSITTSTTNDPSGILGGWAISSGTAYAANDGAGNIVPYAGYTVVSDGGTIASGGATNVQVVTAGSITGPSAGQTVDINTLSLSTAATTAATTITNDPQGTLRLGAKGGIAVFGGTFTGGTLTMNGGTLTAGGANDTAGQINIFANAGGTAAAPRSMITINSAITDNGSGPVSVAFGGMPRNYVALATLAGTNSYSGGTTIPAGFVIATNGSAFGTGPVTVLNSGQAFLNSNDNFANNFFIAGNGPVKGSSAASADTFGAIRMTSGTLSGTVTLEGEAGILSQGTSTISGQITGTGNLTLGNNVSFTAQYSAEQPGNTIILSNTNNNWSGDLIISNLFFNNTTQQTLASVILGNANVIPSGSGAGNVYLQASASAPFSSSVALVLNGYNQTVNGLGSLAGSGGTIATISNSSATPVTLTLGANNATASFAGVIIDGGPASLSLTKIGNGTQILSGSNTFSGPISIQGGVLNLTNANTTTGATTINSAELLLSGSGAINGTSSVTLNSISAKLITTSSIAGLPAVNVMQGYIDGTGTLGAVSVASAVNNVVTNGFGGTGTLTLSSLAFAGSATVTVNDSGSTATPGIVVAGILNASNAGKVVIGANGSSWTNGAVYDLVGYGSLTGSGSATAFVRGPVSGLTSRQTAILGNSGGFITLTIAGDSPKWTGSDSSNWTAGSTGAKGDWKLISEGSSTNFQQGDNVLFDDTAVTGNVVISTSNVAPSAMTINNNSLNYTITSAGGYGITSGNLIKSGSANLTISTANSFAGGATINNGVLILGNSAALGSFTSSLTMNGGTLDLHGVSPTVGAFSATGGIIASNGGGASTLTVNVAANSTYAGTLTDNTDAEGGTLAFVKGGTGTLLLASSNSLSGPTSINAGAIQLGEANSLQNSTVAVNSPNGLTFSASNAANPSGIGTFNMGGLSGNPGGVTQGFALVDSAGTAVMLVVGANNASTTYNGGISGAGGLTKVGSGNTVLNGNVIFSGPLNVTNGTMQFGVGTPGGITTISPGATVWINATTINPFQGGAVYGTLLGSGTLDVTAFNPATGSTSFIGDMTGFAGLIDLLPNPSSNKGTFDTNGYFGIATVVKIEDGTSFKLGSGLFYSNAFLLSGTGNSDNLGTLRLDGNLSGAATVLGSVTLLGNSTIGNQSGNVGTILGNIGQSGGSFSLTKVGTGAILISGSDTYTGGTVVSAGSLQLGSATALPFGAATVNGTLDLSGNSASVTSLTGSGTIDSSDINNAVTLSVQNGNFSGTLKNSQQPLALTMTGPGTLVLSGNNSFSGGLSVSGGTLMATSVAALPDGSSLTVGNAGAFPAPVVPYASSTTAAAVSTVPEPGTLALLAAGAVALLWRRGRRGARAI
jgi:autotransporter-associated beta strand protein